MAAEDSAPERIPASFSAFLHLNSLSPPSPAISPAQVPGCPTSDDIPIFFDFPSSDSSILIPDSCTQPDQLNSPIRDGSDQPKESTCGHTVDDTASLGSDGELEELAPFQAALPPDFYESVDTFGLAPGRRRFYHSLDSATPPPAWKDSSYGNLYEKELWNDYRQTAFHDMEPPAKLRVLENDYTSTQDYTHSLEYTPRLDFVPTLSTPRFALPSAFSDDSIASCPVTPSHLEPLAPLTPKKSKNYPNNSPVIASSVSSNSLTLGSPTMSVPSTPLYQTSFYHRTPPTPCKTPQDNLGLQSSESILSSNSQFVVLPKKLAWLEQTTVELLIDQEGFRGIQPIFRFAGYSVHSRAFANFSSPKQGGLTGSDLDSADFLPVTRQRFNFHYAPFDCAYPTLRRITVNNDESRDYISRQASINMKSNGVYVVRGSEHFQFSSSGHKENQLDGEPVKLRWRFEYSISDRLAEHTGRPVEGEKIFTPLTFSCSPMLLHPLQGKKIKLMHVMKKTVAPNIVAEKMEPPLPPVPSPSLDFSEASAIGDTRHHRQNSSFNPHSRGASTALAMPFALSVHRRAQSQTPTKKHENTVGGPRDSTTKSHFFHLGFGKSSHGNPSSSPTKHRPIVESNTVAIHSNDDAAALTKRPPGRRRASSASEYTTHQLRTISGPTGLPRAKLSFAPAPSVANGRASTSDTDRIALNSIDAVPHPKLEHCNSGQDFPSRRVDRQIISRAVLSELMANEVQPNTSFHERTPSPEGFYPLPPPRRKL